MKSESIATAIPIPAGSSKLHATVLALTAVEIAGNAKHSASTRILDAAAQPAFAENVIACELEHRNAVTLARVVEEAGAADGLRDAVLYGPETFKIAAEGFEAKATALREIQPLTRKALGDARGRHTQAGLNMALIERTPDVAILRAHAERIEAEIQNADVMCNYCRNRKPADRHQHSFETIRGTLAAALPEQMQTAVAA